MSRKFSPQAGFFSIHFLFFLTLISTTLIAYSFIFYTQKQKDLFRKICYYDLAKTQKQLVQYEKQLFLLNPLSTALRLRLKILYVQLAAALAAQNALLVEKTKYEIEKVISQQKKLDQFQKALIQQAQLHIKIQIELLQLQIQKSNHQEKLIWKYWVRENRNYHLKKNVIFAVEPDSIGGLAPNYELHNNYKALQELRLSLQLKFSNEHNQNLLPTQKEYDFLCSISFSQQRNQWTLEINQDRPL